MKLLTVYQDLFSVKQSYFSIYGKKINGLNALNL